MSHWSSDEGRERREPSRSSMNVDGTPPPPFSSSEDSRRSLNKKWRNNKPRRSKSKIQ